MTTQVSFKSRKAGIMKELEAILGEDNLSDNPAVRSSYRWTWLADPLLPPGKGPQIVVMPREVEQVQGVVKLANKEKLRIMPIDCNTMCVRLDADILMDMSRMDKIIRIDPENSYVLLEPGVTYNRLDPLIRETGHTVSRGNFQGTMTVCGYSGIVQGVHHNMADKCVNQVLGLEVVAFDGSLVRTGTGSLCDEYWMPFSPDLPNINGLFKANAQNTPLMGIITKAAIKLHPMMEAQALPIGGFDSFAKAMKFSQKVAKVGIADQSQVWNWVLCGMHEYRSRGGKEDIDFLTYRMNHDYPEPYPGLYYCYTWTSFRGYKEQVDVNLKLCERIAKEMGGKILTDAELEDTIPYCWKSWIAPNRDYDTVTEKKGKHLWLYGGGEGMVSIGMSLGHIGDLIKVEEAYNRRLTEKYNQHPQPYFVGMYEGGVGGFLRYILAADPADEYQQKRIAKMTMEMGAWVSENFPTTIYSMGGRRRVYGPDDIGFGSFLDKIREGVDPNHIGYRMGEKRLEPEED